MTGQSETVTMLAVDNELGRRLYSDDEYGAEAAQNCLEDSGGLLLRVTVACSVIREEALD